MGQVENDRLYTRYRSSSRKNKAEKYKKLTDYNYILLLFHCSIYSILDGWTYKKCRNKAGLKTYKKTISFYKMMAEKKERKKSVYTLHLLHIYAADVG